MKARCDNKNAPNFSAYGGRGISYDPRWASFKVFLADMGLRPVGLTLDRRNNEGPYNRENCRWATPSEQQRNKRPFKQPPGKVYGARLCGSCLSEYTARSPASKRCPTCQPGRRKLRYET